MPPNLNKFTCKNLKENLTYYISEKKVAVISMKVNREEAIKFNGAIYTNGNYFNHRLNVMQEINIANTTNFINITLDEILRRLINEEKYHEVISIINSLTFNLLRGIIEGIGLKIKDPSEIPIKIQEMKNKNIIDEKTRDKLIIAFLIKEGIITQVYEYNKKLNQEDIEKMKKIIQLLNEIARKMNIQYSNLYFTRTFESTSLSYLT